MLTEREEKAIASVQAELKALILTLCGIPAPSNHEEKRAEFIRDWFAAQGFPQAHVDPALNVVCPFHDDGQRPITVIMGHTDTVFPDTEPYPMKEEDGRLYCPGAMDDTAQTACVMLMAREFMRNGDPGDRAYLFVANSGEEGLGNLKGSRQIVKDYGSRIGAFITFDGGPKYVVNRAVGSHRYRVTCRTEGGHSWSRFGNRNAIRELSRVIDALYSVEIPAVEGSRTTYNVGTITGGTSVNTIAQQAEMLYEYRSSSAFCLAQMKETFEGIIEAFRDEGLDLSVEQVGDRPCSPDETPEAQLAMDEAAGGIIRETLGEEPGYGGGSTDANIPLSLGIPAAAMGACTGGLVHTRGEYLDLDSLQTGCRMVLATMKRFSGPL